MILKYSLNKRYWRLTVSSVIFILGYILEWYRIPKGCMVILIAYKDNFPPVLSNFDIYISNIIFSVSNQFLTYAMVFITLVGGVIPLLSIVLILYINGYRKESIYTLLTLLSVILVVSILKSMFHRYRPYSIGDLDLKNLFSIKVDAREVGYNIECIRGFSFPSGHAARISGVLGVFFYIKSKWRDPLLVLSILIGLSRIYLGLHFFTDVFVGWIIGFLIGYLISILLDRFLENRIRQVLKDII